VVGEGSEIPDRVPRRSPCHHHIGCVFCATLADGRLL
jgi:hypothetical protein